MELTHFSTFTGIAGFDLAAEWAGFKTIGQVEKNPYRRGVLRKHWPDVPLWEDIRDVTEESLKEAGIMADPESWAMRNDSQNFGKTNREKHPPTNTSPSISSKTKGGGDGTPSPVTLVTGGFPCQSFSVAGKRRGKADDRYLWPEMFRVIKLLRPHWVLAENVTGIIRMALDDVLSDLESEGYSTQAFVIPACAVDTPHRRDRVWIAAHSRDERRGGRRYGDEGGDLRALQAEGSSSAEEQSILADPSLNGLQGTIHPGDSLEKSRGIIKGCEVAGRSKQTDVLYPTNSKTTRQREYGGQIYEESKSARPDFTSSEGWWATEPEVGRVAHGVPDRVDRLAALGDAIVPQVAYEILKNIAGIERSIRYS